MSSPIGWAMTCSVTCIVGWDEGRGRKPPKPFPPLREKSHRRVDAINLTTVIFCKKF